MLPYNHPSGHSSHLLACNRQAAHLAQDSTAKQVDKEAQVALHQQLHSLKTRLEAAIQTNSSLEPQLQLPSEEVMLNMNLRYQPVPDGCFLPLRC